MVEWSTFYAEHHLSSKVRLLLSQEWDVSHCTLDVSGEPLDRIELPVPFLLIRRADDNNDSVICHACLDLLSEGLCRRILGEGGETAVIGEVTYVIVDTNERGNGLGQSILLHLEKKAIETYGMSHLALTCKESLLPFYQKAGYTPTINADDTDHQSNPLTWMIKELPKS
jgi:GNAT superfamily N-acetyltransferase